jgi:hypothetical protein
MSLRLKDQKTAVIGPIVVQCKQKMDELIIGQMDKLKNKSVWIILKF